MDVREFVIRLVLDAMGFRREVENAQRDLDNLGQAGERAAREAGAGVDDLSRAAADAGNDLRNAGRQGREAGERAAQGARQASSAWSEFGDVASKVGAFLGGVAMIKGAISSYTEQVTAIDKMSRQLGMSVEDVQGWQQAAKESGANVDDLLDNLSDLGDYAQEYGKLGSGALTDFAEATKLSVKDAAGNMLPIQDIFLNIAKTMEGMSKQEATFWAKNIGINENLFDMLNKGEKGLRALIRVGKEKAIYDKRDIELARTMTNIWLGLQTVWTNVVATVMRVVGPAFAKLGEWLKKVGDWVENNGDSVIAWVVALATVFAVGLAPAIWGAMTPLLPFIAAFVLLGATLDDLVVFAGGGQSAIEKLMERMGASRETIESVRSAVKKCIDFFKDLWAVLTGNDNDAAAALERIRAKIEALKESFKALFVGIGNWIGNLFTRLSKALMDWIPDPIKEFLGLDGKVEAPAASAPKSSRDNQLDMAATGGVGSPAAMMKANATALPPASPAALGPAGGGTINNSKQVTTTVTVGEINVQSSSSDPNAVAQAVPNALRGEVAQAETAFGT